MNKKKKSAFINVNKLLNSKKYPFELPKNPITAFNLNDFSYIREVNNVVEKIQSICSNPRTHLIADKQSKNVETVIRLDNSDLRETTKRGKYWKNRNGEAVPERVFADVFDTDLAIYENRFVIKLVNKLLTFINAELRSLMLHIGSISNHYQSHDAYNHSASDMCKLSNILAPSYGISKSLKRKSFLTINKPVLVETVQRLLLIRKHLSHIVVSKFYKIVQKSKPLNDIDIHPTNILTGDSTYAPCYNFYLKLNKLILSRKEEININNQNYFNYVAFRLLKDLKKLRYSFISTRIKLIKGQVKLSNFKLKSKSYNVIINSNNMHFDLLFRLSFKNRYFLKTNDLNIKKLNKISIDLIPNMKSNMSSVYIDDLINKKLVNGYNNAFIVTSQTPSINDSVIVCSPYTHKLDSNISTMLKSMTLITEGDEFIYTHICPVCGNSFIGVEEKGHYLCPICNSSYSFIPLKTKNTRINLVWIKRIKSK